MLRSRAPEILQRSSSPRAPLRDRTNTCNASSGIRNRSNKPENPPRATRASPFYEKKRGSKLAELEKKLNKAMEEVKMLKDKVVLAEAARQGTDKTNDRKLSCVSIQEQLKDSQEAAESKADEPVIKENYNESDQKQESTVLGLKVEEDTSLVSSKNETEEVYESHETEQLLIPESSEVVELKARLLVKEEEIEFLLQQNMTFKTKANEQADCIAAAAKTKEEELIAKLSSVEEKLKASKAKEEQLRVQIEVAEAAKAVAEVDVRRMKVQSEQWRKAAEAAAAVMATGNGIGECRKSMDVNLVSGGVGKWRMSSVTIGELEDGVVDEGKRKGAGIRIFGDLLKKKSQQHK